MTDRSSLILLATAATLSLAAAPALADPLSCAMTGYKAADGLTAAMEGDALVVTWSGDPGQDGRLRFVVNGGAPMVQDLSLRAGGGAWTSVVSNVSPDFSVVSGVRRMSMQQLRPLYDLKVPITQEILNTYRWDPFWDAPLDLRLAIRHARGRLTLDGVVHRPRGGLWRTPVTLQPHGVHTLAWTAGK